MTAIRVFVALACVVCFTGNAARTDEPKKPEKQQLALFTVPDKSGVDEIVERLRERGFKRVGRVPLFSAIFVWGTSEELRDVILLLGT